MYPNMSLPSCPPSAIWHVRPEGDVGHLVNLLSTLTTVGLSLLVLSCPLYVFLDHTVRVYFCNDIYFMYISLHAYMHSKHI